jgi:hypothetical protein
MPRSPLMPRSSSIPESFATQRTRVKLADYCGKIRRIMLHKPEIAGQSPCFASKTRGAGSMGAIDPGVGAYSFESFSTLDVSMNHFMAGQSMILKQFVAVLEDFCSESSKKNAIFG